MLMRFLSLLVFLLPLCAQDPPKEAPKQGGGGRGPRNLKVLKPEDLRSGIMAQFTQALGVKCDFCHVQDRASDELDKKLTARMMIGMAHDINAKFPDGKVHVTCYTCHRGKTTPDTAAPPAPPAQ
jgi:hypothetical protein